MISRGKSVQISGRVIDTSLTRREMLRRSAERLAAPLPFEVREWLVDATRRSPPCPIVGMWLMGLIEPQLIAETWPCHRPPQDRDILFERELLAAGCSALVSAGLSGKQASQKIAAIATRAGVTRPGGRAVVATTVYDWWKKFRRTAGHQRAAEQLGSDASGRDAIARRLFTALETARGLNPEHS